MERPQGLWQMQRQEMGQATLRPAATDPREGKCHSNDAQGRPILIWTGATMRRSEALVLPDVTGAPSASIRIALPSSTRTRSRRKSMPEEPLATVTMLDLTQVSHQNISELSFHLVATGAHQSCESCAAIWHRQCRSPYSP